MSTSPTRATRFSPAPFAEGGYNVAFVNNNYFTNRNQHVFWAGVKYSVTPTFDIAASYYGIRQDFFTVGNSPGAGTFFTLPGVAGIPATIARPGGGAAFTIEMPPARFTRGQGYHWFVKGDLS